MSGCEENNAPPGYTANFFATNAYLELLATEGLTRENNLKVLNWVPTQGRQEMLCSHESEGNPE